MFSAKLLFPTFHITQGTPKTSRYTVNLLLTAPLTPTLYFNLIPSSGINISINGIPVDP